MNIPLGEDVTLGDVQEAGKMATSLTKSLPGMAKKEDGGTKRKIDTKCNHLCRLTSTIFIHFELNVKKIAEFLSKNFN